MVVFRAPDWRRRFQSCSPGLCPRRLSQVRWPHRGRLQVLKSQRQLDSRSNNWRNSGICASRCDSQRRGFQISTHTPAPTTMTSPPCSTCKNSRNPSGIASRPRRLIAPSCAASRAVGPAAAPRRGVLPICLPASCLRSGPRSGRAASARSWRSTGSGSRATPWPECTGNRRQPAAPTTRSGSTADVARPARGNSPRMNSGSAAMKVPRCPQACRMTSVRDDRPPPMNHRGLNSPTHTHL